MRCKINRTAAFLILVTSVIGQARASWFSHAGNGDEKVDQLTPDATVHLTFPNRSTLGFDPSLLHIRAVYGASQPNEKGVRREMHTTSSSPKIPVPFVGSTQKYQVVVERSVMLHASWISASGANGMAIKVPESLPGPGAYQLARLELPCFDDACTRNAHPNQPLTLNMKGRTAPVSKMTDVLHLHTAQASSVVTAAYDGRALALVPSEGSQAAFAQAFDKKEAQALRAVQDAKGQWHISPNALIMLFAGNDSCAEPWMSDEKSAVKTSLYPALAWARRFEHVAHGTVYTSPQLDRFGEMKPVHLANWSGCVAIKGEGSARQQGSDEEIRYYGFNEGRLIYRRRQSYDGRVSLDERIEIDGDKRPLFVERTEYRHRSMKEKKLRWSRLVEEVLPNQIQDTIPVDIGALMSEGEDVKKVIAPSFVPR